MCFFVIIDKKQRMKQQYLSKQSFQYFRYHQQQTAKISQRMSEQNKKNKNIVSQTKYSYKRQLPKKSIIVTSNQLLQSQYYILSPGILTTLCFMYLIAQSNSYSFATHGVVKLDDCDDISLLLHNHNKINIGITRGDWSYTFYDLASDAFNKNDNFKFYDIDKVLINNCIPYFIEYFDAFINPGDGDSFPRNHIPFTINQMNHQEIHTATYQAVARLTYENNIPYLGICAGQQHLALYHNNSLFKTYSIQHGDRVYIRMASLTHYMMMSAHEQRHIDHCQFTPVILERPYRNHHYFVAPILQDTGLDIDGLSNDYDVTGNDYVPIPPRHPLYRINRDPISYEESLTEPDSFTYCTIRVPNSGVMALSHKNGLRFSTQFHPELSFQTFNDEYSHPQMQYIKNFLRLAQMHNEYRKGEGKHPKEMMKEVSEQLENCRLRAAS